MTFHMASLTSTPFEVGEERTFNLAEGTEGRWLD
jgi:hypothetical protein